MVDQPARPPRCWSTAETFEVVGRTEVVGARTAGTADRGSTAGPVDSPAVLVVGRPWLALRC